MSAAWTETAASTEPTLTREVSIRSGIPSDSDGIDRSNQTENLNQHVHELARKFTAQSHEQHHESPFSAAKDSWLDPQSEHFRARDWAKAFYNLRYSSDDAVPRVAGVAFKDLNVWGNGSPTDFQSTVGNTILKLPSLFNRHAQRINILRNLDGLVLPGEQLCVLGPPG